MISAELLETIRRGADEESADQYSDTLLDQMYTANGSNANAAIAAIWREKAARWASLTDTKDGHKLGQLAENARKMAAYHDSVAASALSSVTSAPRTRAIVRP